jgi:hypothetical protein
MGRQADFGIDEAAEPEARAGSEHLEPRAHAMSPPSLCRAGARHARAIVDASCHRPRQNHSSASSWRALSGIGRPLSRDTVSKAASSASARSKAHASMNRSTRAMSAASLAREVGHATGPARTRRSSTRCPRALARLNSPAQPHTRAASSSDPIRIAR